MPLPRSWSFRSKTPDTFLLLYGPDVAGLCRWIVDRREPTVTMGRICAGLDGLGPTPPRTWTWQRIGQTSTVALLHNGIEVGEIEWQDRVKNKTKWSTRAVDGLNLTGDRRQLPPEPVPTRRPTHLDPPVPCQVPGLRLVEYVPGDFDVNDPEWRAS